MVNVYYTKTNSKMSAVEISEVAKNLLTTIVTKEKIKLEKEIPLKVHFGEKGNTAFLKPNKFKGVIKYLKDKKIKSCYIETNTIYGGQRHRKDLHLKLAKEHGFTQLPIVIADGESGENYAEIEINKKYYKKCKIGKEFTKYKQLLMISHFKGHMMAGFGGALKQLCMGFASKGGKLSMHMGSKPQITDRKCTRCHLCQERCNVDAITIADKPARSFIDHDKCVACGACVPICPVNAISFFTLKGIIRGIGIGNNFREKMIEGAYAAQKGKQNIYIQFATEIVGGCDCEPRAMKPVTKDIGIFVSTDPVAIDKACWDLAKEQGKKFRGAEQFDYAEEIGLGSQKYRLIEVEKNGMVR